MNKYSKYGQNKMIIGLLSMLFLISPPFETNTQNCGMITVTVKKKKEEDQTDKDLNQDK